MALLKELQDITERTYQEFSGINLEDFIISRHRFVSLSGQCNEEIRQLSDVARVFFRRAGNCLYLAMYFSSDLIAKLEKNDPRYGLNERNILPFMVFIEEINHGVHGAIKFTAGETEVECENFACDLELMAKIDAYHTLKFFMAYFNPSQQLETFDRLWIKHHLFERSRFDYSSSTLARRYGSANALGEKYTRYIDSMTSEARLKEIRRFRSLNYESKVAYIRMLP